MDPIYEVRVLIRGDYVIHEMVPLNGEMMADSSHSFMHKGTVVVGQTQTAGGLQPVHGDFTVEFVAASPAEAFDRLPDMVSKEIKKCRKDFVKQMTQKKIINPFKLNNRM